MKQLKLVENVNYDNCPCSGKNLAKLVRPALLALLHNRSMHGYEIAMEIGRHGWFDDEIPDLSGIYRILSDCEKAGMVISHWDTPDHGGAKKIYSLTPEGEVCLKKWHDTLAKYLVQITRLNAFIGESVSN